jgi:signal transduction histidine kinase
MIPGMETLRARAPAPDPAPTSRKLPAVLAGVGGCLFLVAATSTNVPSFLTGGMYSTVFSNYAPSTLLEWLYLAVPAAATACGLYLLRWWPYLLAAAGLLAVPGVLAEWGISTGMVIEGFAPPASFYLAVVALLACAQGLVRTTAGWGAAVAALVLGSCLVGSAMTHVLPWGTVPGTVPAWQIALLGVGLAGLAPAVWFHRRGDSAAAGSAGSRPGERVRVIVAGTLAAAMRIPLSLLTAPSLAHLLGVSWSAIYRHNFATGAVIGAIALVAVFLLAALAGLWPLAGALIAAAAQVAVVAPALLAVSALNLDGLAPWLAALAGAALGAAAAGSRLRLPLAATLTLLAATALVIAYGATTGDPEKLAEQHTTIPAVLILVLCAAAATSVVGSVVPTLAPRGAVPAVLGPLAGVLAFGGLELTSESYGLSNYAYSPVTSQVIISAVLLPVAGIALCGMGFAQLLAARRAERKQAEQIRREAAEAERDRLARPIHDGVLQVLALVQRQGAELGPRGGELAALAGEQEAALRGLLAGGADAGRDEAEDLRAPLKALAASGVEVVTPAQPVELPAATAAEVIAAVRAALDNVREHAGADAHAWVLLENERDGVRVTVRDDGVGFPPQRPAEAAEAGRLGIAQSMRGRIADRGGTTTIDSRPGEGTTVEFRVPRVPPARR